MILANLLLPQDRGGVLGVVEVVGQEALPPIVAEARAHRFNLWTVDGRPHELVRVEITYPAGNGEVGRGLLLREQRGCLDSVVTELREVLGAELVVEYVPAADEARVPHMVLRTEIEECSGTRKAHEA